MNKLTRYFFELIQIDSPSGNESAVHDYLESWLKRWDFATRTDSVGNLYAYRKSNSKPGQPLLLCAHMDTVQPGVGIKPIIADGYYQSCGTTILGADDKASVAAIMVAVESYLSDRKGVKRGIEILFTVREEVGGGVEHFPFHWIKSKEVIISDLSRPLGTIGIGAPFIVNFYAEMKGKAAHSSKPKEGKNAFLGLKELLTAFPFGEFDNGLTMINLGKISGGTAINAIPEKVILEGEVRSFTVEFFQKGLDSIESLVEGVGKQLGLETKFAIDGYCPGYLYDDNNPLVQKVSQVLKGCHLPVILEKTFGVSDANIIAYHGLSTVVISDGVEHPHTVSEKVSVLGLRKLAEIILELLQNV